MTRFLEKSVENDQPRHVSDDQRVQDENTDLGRTEWLQRIGMQKWIVPSVLILVGLWLIFVIIIVVLDGMDCLDYHPSVLVTLLGSATASIVGLLMRVINYTLPTTD